MFLQVLFLFQVKLAEALEASGADIIQTEGGTSSAPINSGVHGLIEKVRRLATESALIEITTFLRGKVEHCMWSGLVFSQGVLVIKDFAGHTCRSASCPL